MVKTGSWECADAETRKPGERTGLETPVVLAVNDGYLAAGEPMSFSAGANVLSTPPGEYARKGKTQRN